MNKILFFIAAAAFVVGACVDDYTDANPPGQLDAPTLRFSGAAGTQKIETVPVNAYQSTYRAYATYGEPVEFNVSVIDAPGRVASVTVAPSVPEYGTVSLNDASVSGLIGQEKGDFKFTFTPNPALPDVSDRAMNLVVTVTDSQLDQEGQALPKATTLTIATSLVACIAEGIEEGTYVITEASGNLDGGDPYTLDDLKTDGEAEFITVEITKERPGLYTFDEITGGVWPVYNPGRANPEIGIDFCTNSFRAHEGQDTAGDPPGPVRQFAVEGTLNANGTITVTWSYELISGTTPDDPAKGTYTLTKM
jgi:hypothetical protein